MRQSSLSFPSFASDCMVFFVSLWLRHEDTCAHCEKYQSKLYIFYSLIRIFAVNREDTCAR